MYICILSSTKYTIVCIQNMITGKCFVQSVLCILSVLSRDTFKVFLLTMNVVRTRITTYLFLSTATISGGLPYSGEGHVLSLTSRTLQALGRLYSPNIERPMGHPARCVRHVLPWWDAGRSGTCRRGVPARDGSKLGSNCRIFIKIVYPRFWSTLRVGQLLELTGTGGAWGGRCCISCLGLCWYAGVTTLRAGGT